MSKPFKYDLSPERIEELFNSEMNPEEKSMWKSCNEFLQRYSGASKQLVDVRMREWNNEYHHDLLKAVGGIRHNCSKHEYPTNRRKYTKHVDNTGIKNKKRSDAQKRRFADPKQRELQREYCRRAAAQHTENCKYRREHTVQYIDDETVFDMPNFDVNKEVKEYNENIII